jgi:hypothetical protein
VHTRCLAARCTAVVAMRACVGATAGEPSGGGGGGGGGISGGAIAGIVIGVLAGIALLAIAVWFCLRRRRARRGDMEMAKHHHDSPMSAAASGNKGAHSFHLAVT